MNQSLHLKHLAWAGLGISSFGLGSLAVLSAFGGVLVIFLSAQEGAKSDIPLPVLCASLIFPLFALLATLLAVLVPLKRGLAMVIMAAAILLSLPAGLLYVVAGEDAALKLTALGICAIVFIVSWTYLILKRNQPNKAVDSTATRVTPPADPSLRSGQESRHGQP
jgi:hypothetical protein